MTRSTDGRHWAHVQAVGDTAGARRSATELARIVSAQSSWLISPRGELRSAGGLDIADSLEQAATAMRALGWMKETRTTRFVHWQGIPQHPELRALSIASIAQTVGDDVAEASDAIEIHGCLRLAKQHDNGRTQADNSQGIDAAVRHRRNHSREL